MSVSTKRAHEAHWVVLDRPEERNCLDKTMREALLGAILETTPDDRALIISGNGQSFCAGQDLREFTKMPDVKTVMKEEYEPILAAIANAPCPVIAMVQGAASGAGVSLALACDIVIASEESYFDIGFARIGLIPDIGLSYTLPRLIGPARAMRAAMLGERVDAARALKWGMISEIAPDDLIESRVIALVRAFETGSKSAQFLTRKLLRASLENDLHSQLAYEAETQAKAASHPDFEEGLRAFKEKRPPRFS